MRKSVRAWLYFSNHQKVCACKNVSPIVDYWIDDSRLEIFYISPNLSIWTNIVYVTITSYCFVKFDFMNGRPLLYLVKPYLQLHHHLLLPTDVNFLTRHQVWISVATLLQLARFSETSENKTGHAADYVSLRRHELKKINKTETNRQKKGWLLSSKNVG